MTSRKKKGIGYFISGTVFIVVGFVMTTMDADPAWLSAGLALVGLIAEFFGFQKVFPDVD